MSILFEPRKLGGFTVKNCFIRSGTMEAMAFEETGEIAEQMIDFYKILAEGEIGLIITGLMYIDPLGKASQDQTGIHEDSLIVGLKRLANCIHERGSKVCFQLAHSGMQTSKEFISGKAISCSSKRRSPFTFIKGKKMDNRQISETINAFKSSAERAFKAGADAVQIHAAHGYLVNQFLSPFFNIRKDEWGGSDENQFRFLKEIVLSIKSILPKSKSLLVKLNTNDYTKENGITPSLAVKYAKWLAELGIDGLEISCGTVHFSPYNIFRGRVPFDEGLHLLPRWKRPLARFILKKWIGNVELEGEYNLDTAKLIKPVLKDVPLILVGGIRDVSRMEDIINRNQADFISMSRPFLREPNLVKKIKSGETKKASCVSCNRCFVAVAARFPVGCYIDGIPKEFSRSDKVNQ